MVEVTLNLINIYDRKLHFTFFLLVSLFSSDLPFTRYWDFFENGWQKYAGYSKTKQNVGIALQW